MRHQPKIQPAMSHDTPILPGLSPVDRFDIHARFDGGALSSDGGVLLLREIERRMGISDVLASCLWDRRDPVRTQHSYASMIRARVMAIACGYEDCDDMDALRHDPAMKMACECRHLAHCRPSGIAWRRSVYRSIPDICCRE